MYLKCSSDRGNSLPPTYAWRVIRSWKLSHTLWRWTTVIVVSTTLVAADSVGNDVMEGSSGWRVTVYYTPVESFHGGARQVVRGCPRLEGCDNGDAELGQYPSSFVAAAREEGSGRITTGPYASQYLNWSYDIGYWLDTAPRDSIGRELEPFRSAAADGVPMGSQVRLIDCGTLEEGGKPEDAVCRRLKAGSWEIRDEFTPGLGGAKHLDMYVGEETDAGFTESSLYTTLVMTHLEF